MRTLHLLAIGVVAVGLLVGSAEAIAPGFLTDTELLQYPIIVIATWDKAAARDHARVNGNVLEEDEIFTELNVHRVIKGDIQLGKHTLVFNWGVNWKKDGTGLATYTSTDIPGDVNNVSEPNIWFLDRVRSWDDADKTVYLHLPHYRAIQPRILEEYFAALGSKDPQTAVPKFLSFRQPPAAQPCAALRVRGHLAVAV